jgi:hypothetical protein
MKLDRHFAFFNDGRMWLRGPRLRGLFFEH